MSVYPQRLPDYDRVEIWMVEGPRTDAEVAACGALLSPEELQRYKRFKVESARRDFVISRGSLRTLLSGVLDRSPTEIRLGRGKHGKPFVEHPEGDLEFNVSHSGDVFLYAMTRGRVLGVDVERNKPDRDLDRLAERFFAPGEARRLLEEGRPEDLIENFYRCWTRKEAYLKAKGLGITMQLDAFEVTFLPEEAPRLLHTEVTLEDPAIWGVHEIEVPDGYTAALVVPAEGP